MMERKQGSLRWKGGRERTRIDLSKAPRKSQERNGFGPLNKMGTFPFFFYQNGDLVHLLLLVLPFFMVYKRDKVNINGL